MQLVLQPGATVGFWTLQERKPYIRVPQRQRAKWVCQCVCGQVKEVQENHLLSGASTNCRCKHWEQKYAGQPSLPIRQLYTTYKSNAKIRQLAFELALEQFATLVVQPCHYCDVAGVPLNGLDRVNNNKGYIADNVVACCTPCNIAKRDRTAAEFLAWADRLYKHQHKEVSV